MYIHTYIKKRIVSMSIAYACINGQMIEINYLLKAKHLTVLIQCMLLYC